jgi:hypothetical protein
MLLQWPYPDCLSPPTLPTCTMAALVQYVSPATPTRLPAAATQPSRLKA